MRQPGLNRGASERRSRSNFTPEALADVLDRIRALRDEGVGWPTIAWRFNDDGVPTALGGSRAASTVRGIASGPAYRRLYPKCGGPNGDPP